MAYKSWLKPPLVCRKWFAYEEVFQAASGGRNHFPEVVNIRLQMGGMLVVCAETNQQRKARLMHKYPPLFNKLYYLGDYLVMGYCPNCHPSGISIPGLPGGRATENHPVLEPPRLHLAFGQLNPPLLRRGGDGFSMESESFSSWSGGVPGVAGGGGCLPPLLRRGGEMFAPAA